MVSMWKYTVSTEVSEGEQGPWVSQADDLTEIQRVELGNIAGDLRERNKD